MARKSRKNLIAEPVRHLAPAVMYDVGAYVRLSAVDRKQKGDSIETQQAIIQAFVADHPDLVLREVYIDNGNTGTTFERPAFQRMLEDAESGKINCLISKDLSRFGRNAIDTGYYIEKYFPTHHIRFIAINDNYDSADGENGGMMITLKNIVNESYALEIGRKIRATKQMNIREGAFVGRFPPYGYQKSEADSHKLVIDAYAAPIVLQMYQMAAEGCSVNAIATHLNDAGILPPKKYFHQNGLASEKEACGHIHWNTSTIYQILHNRIYTGDMVQGKFKTTNSIQKKLPRCEWVVTENTHEAIIDCDLWARVAKRWAAVSPRKASIPYSENVFHRKMFCGHCGYTLRRKRYGKNCYGFLCETRSWFEESDCVQVSIGEGSLKKELLIQLHQHMDGLLDSPLPQDESKHCELAKAQSEREQASGFLKGLYESLMMGDITNEEYIEMKQSYEARISGLSEQIHRLREEKVRQDIREAERVKATEYLDGIHGFHELTAEFIDTHVERIDVFEDKSTKITFRHSGESTAGKENRRDA